METNQGGTYRLRSLKADTKPAQGAAKPSPEPMATDAVYRWSDRLGTWKARWNINRMDYKVKPGLYRLGEPDAEAPVLVTANYKMSFDFLRRELAGRNLWILVLDTRGVNVWCAAGKGTFGTAEVIRRVKQSGLAERVSHHTLVLPQLGAPGVSALDVQRQTGFRVVYGPVRAEDVPAFLDQGFKSTEDMRRVHFTLMDRLVLTPVEIVAAAKPFLLILGVLFLLNAPGWTHFGRFELLVLLTAGLAGTFLTPVLLPWIPGRAFSFKGALMGLVLGAGLLSITGFQPTTSGILTGASGPGWLAATCGLYVIMAVSSYLALNFTGCTTYTSPSGVAKEMKVAIPLQLLLLIIGTLGLIVAAILQ